MSELPVRLRGHHLICLQFFHGQGYSAEFVHNLLGVIERLTTGPGKVVTGHDDVCSACPALCEELQDCERREELEILDALALELLDLKPGDEFDFGEISVMMVPKTFKRWRAIACDGCQWEQFCVPMLDLDVRFPLED